MVLGIASIGNVLLVHPLHLAPGFDGETSEHGIWKLLPA
jgi:hypothetical protein